MALEVVLDGIGYLVGRDGSVFVVVFLQGSQRIDRRGDARAVESEVARLAVERCIACPFDAAVHHERHHRRRHDVEVVFLGTDGIDALGYLRRDETEELVESGGARYLPCCVLHAFGKRHGIYAKEYRRPDLV